MSKPGESLGLKIVATSQKVTLVFNQAVAYLTLNPDSARKLAATIVEAADLAERTEEGKKEE